jgi:asparagine synthase (glutamine-hydrolysing)
MSALYGIINFNGKMVMPDSLQAMSKVLQHRGPDGLMIWTDGPFGLGHAMFNISPESFADKMPYYDAESGLAITAVVRLDNRHELMKELDVATTGIALSDSILILKAYQKWGENCPSRLLGDFAFVIVDIKKRLVFLATDHLGRTPLYYYKNAHLFLFASEIKGILACPDVSIRINMEKIAMLADLGRILRNTDSTYFSEVMKMPAASTILIKNDKVKMHSYWKPKNPKPLRFKDEKEFVTTFQDVFAESVKTRLRSTYPVAALCSGGLDSSAITSMAAKILASENKRLCAFAAVLPREYVGTGTDEREYIDAFKNFENITLHYISDEQRGPFDNLERLVWSGESPLLTSRHYQYSAFAMHAKELGCRIILDGVGGEFGPSSYGDGIFAEWFLHGNWLRLVRELRARSVVEGRSIKGLIRSELIRPFVPSFFARRRPRFDFQQLYNTSPIRESFFTKYCGDNVINGSFDYKLIWPRPNHRQNQLRDLSLLMGIGGGSGYYVGYENVDLRYPFIDKRLIEFCLAAPSQFKIQNGYKRNMIRLGMKGILPDKLRFRISKNPFGPDFHDRYNRQRPEIIEMLSQIKPGDPVREIVDVDKLLSMAQYQMQTNTCRTPMEYAAMHSVPQGIYLITFLKIFKSYWV